MSDDFANPTERIARALWDRKPSPVSDEEYEHNLYGNRVGVFGKMLGGLGLDASGERKAQPWGKAIMSTLDAPAGLASSIGQAVTAPARAYRGEIPEGQMIPEGLNFAGSVALGSAAVPRGRAASPNSPAPHVAMPSLPPENPVMRYLSPRHADIGMDSYNALALEAPAIRDFNPHDAGIIGLPGMRSASQPTTPLTSDFMGHQRFAGRRELDFVPDTESMVPSIGELANEGAGKLSPYDRTTLNQAWLRKVARTGELFSNPKESALPGTVLSSASHLDMSQEARMARAREMGFDTGQTWYHATPAEKIEEFKPELIGSHTDAGHLASGFYFADSPSEAAYYAPNVGSYYTRGKMWDAGGGGTWPEMFKQWAPMMDDVGLLGWRGDTLKSIRAIDGMVDNAKVSPLQDGEFSGYYAYMPHPEPSYEGHEIGSRGSRHNIPKTPDEAIENLRNRAYYELDGSDEFPGLNGIDTFTDFVRTGRLQDEVAKRLTEKGYSGIKYGSELVVFDPTNIRSVNAAFDPAKSSSANLLAANPETGAAPGLGLMAAAKEAERPGVFDDKLIEILRKYGLLGTLGAGAAVSQSDYADAKGLTAPPN